nr:MAG TPA: hypothetical protein [Caudoviricetes sp.]
MEVYSTFRSLCSQHRLFSFGHAHTVGTYVL